MDVFFVSKRLADLLHSPKEMRRAYGARNAELIQHRLDNLLAAETLEQLRHNAGHLHELSGDRAGAFAFRLQGALRLVFAPKGPEFARRPDGSLNWAATRAVVIQEVVDYHD